MDNRRPTAYKISLCELKEVYIILECRGVTKPNIYFGIAVSYPPVYLYKRKNTL